MYPNMNDLYYFSEIAESQNISSAALRLGLTQPSLSTAVVRLENALKAKLLHRSKKGVRLTPEGRELLLRTKKLLQDWHTIVDHSKMAKEQVQGRYTLGCHVSVALYTLPQVVNEWMLKYPHLELRLVHDLSRKILEQIVATEIDLGIVVNPIRHPEVIIKKICDDEVTFWRSESCRDQNQNVLIGDPSLMQTQELLKKAKKIKNIFDRFVSTSSLEVVADLVRSGAGVGVLPSRVAKKQPGLQRISNAPIYNDEICLVYRYEMRSIATIQTLGEDIIRALK